MSASGRDYPQSFREALRVTGELLSRNIDVVRGGTLVTETEQIVMAAYRLATGVELTRLALVNRLDDRYPDVAGERCLVMAGMRSEGHPLQYATGFQTFLEHDYAVGPGVLVPRPETEVLVSEALHRVKGAVRGAEIGLGSGAISIELLSAIPHLSMVASEISAEARAIAERNAANILGTEWKERLRVVMAATPENVLEPLVEPVKSGGHFDFLISNPPYLLRSDEIGEDVRRHEPEIALYSPGADEIHFYRRIAEGAKSVLTPSGVVLVEIPHERAVLIRRTFERAQWKVEVIPDLTGRERVLVACQL